MAWDKLSMRDKSDLMKVYIGSGVRDLNTMREHYNSYADGGVLDNITATLNPYNWGVDDYSDKGNFKNAYTSARKDMQSEFMYNNKRYNTKNTGTSEQQYNMYGNTDKLLNAPVSDYTKKTIASNLVTDKLGEEIDRNVDILNLAGNPNFIDPDAKSIGNVIGRIISNEEGTVRSYYNSINNNIYGKDVLAEQAHGYRNTQEGSEINAFIKSYVKHPFITKKEQLKIYNTNGTQEYDTHKVVEPVLSEYSYGTIKNKEYIPEIIDFYRKNKSKMDKEISFNGKEQRFDIGDMQYFLQQHIGGLDKSFRKDGSPDGIIGPDTMEAIRKYNNKYKPKKK